jgi:hypothetical protein
VLLDGTRTNAQLTGYLLVAAPLNQQVEHLLISGSNLDSIQVHHGSFSYLAWVKIDLPQLPDSYSRSFAKPSLTIGAAVKLGLTYT